MPGFPRRYWPDEPFSYKSLCNAVPILVIVSVVLFSAFEGDAWLPSSLALDVVIVGMTALLMYLFFLKIVWRLLPGEVRARIPYDRAEAQRSKGDVRSLGDLFRLLVSRSVRHPSPGP